jgi:hypothetical protein
MYVIGMGEKKTPNPFISACNRFKYLEIIVNNNKTTQDDCDIDKLDTNVIKKAVSEIIADVSDEDGWAPLSGVGNILTKRFPNFDVRHFHYNKLTPFIKSLGIFEIKSIPSSVDPNVKVISIKEIK